VTDDVTGPSSVASATVVPFTGVMRTPPPAALVQPQPMQLVADPDVARALAEVAENAAQGRIRAFAIAMVAHDGTTHTRWVRGDGGRHEHALTSCLAWLFGRMIAPPA
jgi:hypothetical protein